MSGIVKSLLDQHAERGMVVMEAYLTHTARMVHVLSGIVERNSKVTTALMEFSEAPSQELWLAAAEANLSQSTKIDELLEAYRDCADDTKAILVLVQDALKIVKVAVND